MPAAARKTDSHVCPIHGGGPIATGCGSVTIGYQKAARITDIMAPCGNAIDVITDGASNVIIGYMNAARIGDGTAHKGKISTGCPTVLIGESAQSVTLSRAAASGTPFCEECEKAKAEAAARAKSRPEPDLTSVALRAAAQPPAASTPPETPFTPTPQERALAKAPGDTPFQRMAREKVLRDFYERYANDGLGQARADVDMGVGGSPPRPNMNPKGYGIDLGQPLEVIQFPPPNTMDQYVRKTAGWAGNFFDPLGGQTGDALGLNDDPNIRKKTTFVMPPGEGLQSGNGPIIDDWTDKANPVTTKGGGVQVTVPNSVRKAVVCSVCSKLPCTC